MIKPVRGYSRPSLSNQAEPDEIDLFQSKAERNANLIRLGYPAVCLTDAVGFQTHTRIAPDTVLQIRKRVIDGETNSRKLAREFRISRWHTLNIIKEWRNEMRGRSGERTGKEVRGRRGGKRK